jgi:hypothetical protein
LFPRGYTSREIRGFEAERAKNFEALQQMMGRGTVERPLAKTGEPSDVGEPQVQGEPETIISDIKVPIKEVSPNAPEKREVTEGGVGERERVPQREDLRTERGPTNVANKQA